MRLRKGGIYLFRGALCEIVLIDNEAKTLVYRCCGERFARETTLKDFEKNSLETKEV